MLVISPSELIYNMQLTPIHNVMLFHLDNTKVEVAVCNLGLPEDQQLALNTKNSIYWKGK